jgi:hypothetical protein
MHDTISRLKLVAPAPDITIEIPRDACGFPEVWRAEETSPSVANGQAPRWLDCRLAEGFNSVGDPLGQVFRHRSAAKLQFGQFDA